MHEIPESTSSGDFVGREDLHAVGRRIGILGSGRLATHHLIEAVLSLDHLRFLIFSLCL